MNERNRKSCFFPAVLKLFLLSVTSILFLTALSATASGILMCFHDIPCESLYGVAAVPVVLLAGFASGRAASAILPVRGLYAGGLSALCLFLMMLLTGAMLGNETLWSMWALAEGSLALLGCLTGSILGASKR